jgi:hypothetical protein
MEILKEALPLVNETNIKNYINRYVIIHGIVNSVKNNTLYLSMNTSGI